MGNFAFADKQMDALKEEMDEADHFSPVDTRAVFEVCVILSRVFPAAYVRGRKVPDLGENDTLKVWRPERELRGNVGLNLTSICEIQLRFEM